MLRVLAQRRAGQALAGPVHRLPSAWLGVRGFATEEERVSGWGWGDVDRRARCAPPTHTNGSPGRAERGAAD